MSGVPLVPSHIAQFVGAAAPIQRVIAPIGTLPTAVPTSTLLQISFKISPFLELLKTSLFRIPEGAKINGKGKISIKRK